MAKEKILRQSRFNNNVATPVETIPANFVSIYIKNLKLYKKIADTEYPIEMPMLNLGEIAVHNGTQIVAMAKGTNGQRLAVVAGSPNGIAYLDEFMFTATGIAGEAIPNRSPVRMGVLSLGEDVTKIYNCDASDPLQIGFIGFAYTAYNTGDQMTVLQGPRVDGFTGLVDLDDYFLANGGGIANTPGTNVFQVGTADGTTAIAGVRAQTTLKEYIETTVFETITVENLLVNEITYFDMKGVAGETLAFLDPVRMGVLALAEDVNKVYRCDASNINKLGFIGFASRDYAVGEEVVALQGPRVEGFTGLVDGDDYFLANGGGISNTAGTNVVKVGVADGTTALVGVRGADSNNNYLEINGQSVTINTPVIYANPGDCIVFLTMTSDCTVYLPFGSANTTISVKKRTGEHVYKVNIVPTAGQTLEENPDGGYIDISDTERRFIYIGTTYEVF